MTAIKKIVATAAVVGTVILACMSLPAAQSQAGTRQVVTHGQGSWSL